MKEGTPKDDVEKKPAGKQVGLELAPGVEPSAVLVTKQAGKKDRQKLAPEVESSEDNTHLVQCAAAATAAAAAINQASASRRPPRPPSKQDEDESSSFASSTSSARPGAVRVGDTESNHDELTLQTQEEPNTEQGFETILPIAAEVVQIVETAKVCGQPRWLIFALLGVLVAVLIGAGVGVALGSGGDASVRRVELEEVLIAEIPSVQFGSSQREAIDWLANEDPAMLDFKTTPIRTVLERYVVVTLYYSLNGPDWENQRAFLSEESVCNWSLIKATETTIKGVGCNELNQVVVEINLSKNQLIGKIPSEIGFLTSLTLMDLSKFLYVSFNKVYFVTNIINLDCIASGMNNGLTGMVPTELKELTKLQDLHLSGTALTGSLSLVFCMGDFNIPNFEADCAGQKEVQCSCCTVCCGRIDDEPYFCGQNTFAPSPAPTSDRRNEVEEIISSDIPSFQLGPFQIEALNWLADDDPAKLDFELVTPTELLERFVMALLYFSTGGENWTSSSGSDLSGFFSAMSVCSWDGVGCDPTVVESYPVVVEIRFDSDNLRGQLPTELGLLTSLQLLRLGKFTTMSSSELDTAIALLRSLSYKLPPLRLLQAIIS
jgi:hypothetical protein